MQNLDEAEDRGDVAPDEATGFGSEGSEVDEHAKRGPHEETADGADEESEVEEHAKRGPHEEDGGDEESEVEEHAKRGP